MKKGTFLKKALASACAAAMTLTAFTTASFAANQEIIAVFSAIHPNNLSYWITSNYDTTYFRISSTSNNTSTKIDYSLSADYILYGRKLEDGPLYFNMKTSLLDENDNIIDEKIIRNQYCTLGDVNCDGIVDAEDFYAFERFYNSSFNNPDYMPLYYIESLNTMFDFDRNGKIDYGDYNDLLSYVEDYNFGIETDIGTEKIWTTIDPELGELLEVKDVGKADLFIGTNDTGEVSFGLFGTK